MYSWMTSETEDLNQGRCHHPPPPCRAHSSQTLDCDRWLSPRYWSRGWSYLWCWTHWNGLDPPLPLQCWSLRSLTGQVRALGSCPGRGKSEQDCPSPLLKKAACGRSHSDGGTAPSTEKRQGTGCSETASHHFDTGGSRTEPDAYETRVYHRSVSCTWNIPMDHFWFVHGSLSQLWWLVHHDGHNQQLLHPHEEEEDQALQSPAYGSSSCGPPATDDYETSQDSQCREMEQNLSPLSDDLIPAYVHTENRRFDSQKSSFSYHEQLGDVAWTLV